MDVPIRVTSFVGYYRNRARISLATVLAVITASVSCLLLSTSAYALPGLLCEAIVCLDPSGEGPASCTTSTDPECSFLPYCCDQSVAQYCPGACKEPTATPTATATDTPESPATDTPLPTATHTHTYTATATATDSPQPTSTDTPQATATHTYTATATATDSPQPTSTDTPQPTATHTHTHTATATATDSPQPTSTDTPQPTATHTHTHTATATATDSPQPTSTDTPQPTAIHTHTHTATATATDSPQPTSTDTPQPTATHTHTHTATATATDSPQPTSTDTPQPTATHTHTHTATATATNSPQPKLTDTPRPLATYTYTAVATATSSPSATPANTAQPTPTATSSATATTTQTPAATATASTTPTAANTETPGTPTPGATASTTPTSTTALVTVSAECMQANSDGSFTSYLSYNNLAGVELTIETDPASGSINSIVADGEALSPPTIFSAGVSRGSVVIRHINSSFTWTVKAAGSQSSSVTVDTRTPPCMAVVPRVSCNSRDSVLLGYNNPHPFPIIVPTGGDNFFSAGISTISTIEKFLPGRMESVLAVTLSATAKPNSWTLQSQTVDLDAAATVCTSSEATCANNDSADTIGNLDRIALELSAIAQGTATSLLKAKRKNIEGSSLSKRVRSQSLNRIEVEHRRAIARAKELENEAYRLTIQLPKLSKTCINAPSFCKSIDRFDTIISLRRLYAYLLNMAKRQTNRFHFIQNGETKRNRIAVVKAKKLLNLGNSELDKLPRIATDCS